MERILIVKNQTMGGGDRYCNNVISELKRTYIVEVCSPSNIDNNSHELFVKLYQYVRYVYFYLPEYYKKLGEEITKKKEYKKIIIFQDAYRKCPDIFQTLREKSVYILHEPPREFYEPLNLHAPRLRDKLFTLIFRGPILLIDKINTKKASLIIANSEFSKRKIYKIYNKKSIVVYPGVNILSKRKRQRKHQCISVGSLLPYKGHEDAIRAIGRLSTIKPTLVIVGRGTDDQKRRLSELAEKLRVNIIIYSNPPDRVLGKLYRESLVYINCAYGEPFGMTALEGLGHGCNLVTVNKCGTAELKKYFPGNVYVTSGEDEDISEKIEKALMTRRKEYDFRRFSWATVTNAIISA